MTSLTKSWQRIRTQLQQQISRDAFENWLEPLGFGKLAGGELQLVAPNRDACEWLDSRYRSEVLRAALQLGEPVDSVSFTTRPVVAANGRSNAEGAAQAAPVQQKFEFNARNSLFNSRYSFDSFVVGSCNEFAHAAARAVTDRPAKAYNPLYIYGGVGMGKTHLMHAIGQGISENHPGMRVVYVSSEQFMNEMISSLRYDRMSSFHERFRAADALLIDDIQILGSRERTQEEFFHTFNTLHNMRKQIVISSDSPPKQVPGLVDRLRSRFAWGLMADIQPPDLETKMAILDRKAEETGVKLPDSVRGFLATRLGSNIRELEGTLIRLAAISSLSGNEITLPLAKQALRSITGDSDEKPSIAAIQRLVAEHFQLKPHQLRERSNTKAIARPRQIGMYLSKELLGISLKDVGKGFGGKHHTTVLYAVQKIDRLRRTDSEINSLILTLTDRFN